MTEVSRLRELAAAGEPLGSGVVAALCDVYEAAGDLTRALDAGLTYKHTLALLRDALARLEET